MSTCQILFLALKTPRRTRQKDIFLPSCNLSHEVGKQTVNMHTYMHVYIHTPFQILINDKTVKQGNKL